MSKTKKAARKARERLLAARPGRLSKYQAMADAASAVGIEELVRQADEALRTASAIGSPPKGAKPR